MADLDIIQGESIQYEFEYQDSSGTAIDITNLQITAIAKSTKTNTEIFNASIGSGITIVTALEGKWKLVIEDTTAFAVDSYRMEIAYADNTLIDKPDHLTFKITESLA